MRLEIDWINEHPSLEINNELKELLVDSLELTAQMKDLRGLEFSITLVDNNRIKEINNEYRNKDEITDVISFALNDEADDNKSNLEVDNFLLGDIIISYDKVVEQAKEYQHSLEREFVFLALHGFLHLLGYDHQTPDQEKEMFAIQEKVLSKMKLGAVDDV